jgi:hypothetical protein
MASSTVDKIWYDDVFVLARRPFEFFPVKGQSATEHVNALVRLALYVTTGLYMYSGNITTVFVGLAAIVALTLAYRGRGRIAGLDNVAPRKCRPSTKNNPFANTLVTEFGQNPMPDPPCSYDDIKEDAEKNFNDGLFRNIEDWPNRENSQRQFFTHPTGGNPPDTKAFSEFLYGNARNCKTDSAQCV